MFNQTSSPSFDLRSFFRPIVCREAKRVERNNQRAQRLGQPATLTLKEWLLIIHHYKWKCAFCGCQPYESIDHIMPIALGGGTTAANCVPACHACNNKRGRFVDQSLAALNTLGQIVDQNGR